MVQGQQVYYTTHQFFLSEKAINFLVFPLNEVSDDKIIPWLLNIQARTSRATVYLIGTFLDRLNPNSLEEISASVADAISKHWPNGHCFDFKKPVDQPNLIFWPLSCKNDQGVPNLRSALFFEVSKTTELVTSEMLKLITWVNLKSKELPVPWLESVDLDVQIKKIFQFESDADAQCRLIRSQLHEWGYLLDFQFFNHSSIQTKKVVIKPKWLADLFKTIIYNSKEFLPTVLSKDELHARIQKRWSKDLPLKKENFPDIVEIFKVDFSFHQNLLNFTTWQS
jgi:hypothetical protein